jgi:hypothetical protein
MPAKGIRAAQQLARRSVTRRIPELENQHATGVKAVMGRLAGITLTTK